MLNQLRYKRSGGQEASDTTVSPTTTPSGDGIISPPKPYTPKPEENNKSTDTIAAITGRTCILSVSKLVTIFKFSFGILFKSCICS